MQAQEVFVVADGALWIWNWVADRFAQATQTLDLYHASEHLWGLPRRVNLYPSSVDRLVRRFEAVEEYRVRLSGQRGMCEMAVEIELEPGADPSLADQLAQSLAAAFGLRIPVRTLEPNTLPRFEMKAKRWIREENA